MLNDNKYYPKILDEFIRKLISKNYIIVALTSKTHSEVIKLYKSNNIKFPFSTENGSSFYIPNSNNQKDLTFKNIINKQAIKSLKILNKLKEAPNKFLKHIIFIKDLTFKEQIKITKLKISELEYFNKRQFSIAIMWKGNKALFALFENYLKKFNLQATFGGKMINISGIHNKLDALKYFKKNYIKKSNKQKCTTISIGDSENDIEILNYTDYSGIVIRKDKKNLKLIKNHKVFISTSIAPKGWVELLKNITKEMEK